jgi:hypothetical protein
MCGAARLKVVLWCFVLGETASYSGVAIYLSAAGASCMPMLYPYLVCTCALKPPEVVEIVICMPCFHRAPHPNLARRRCGQPSTRHMYVCCVSSVPWLRCLAPRQHGRLPLTTHVALPGGVWIAGRPVQRHSADAERRQLRGGAVRGPTVPGRLQSWLPAERYAGHPSHLRVRRQLAGGLHVQPQELRHHRAGGQHGLRRDISARGRREGVHRRV